MIKIIVTGCTHNRQPVIQPCDVFIHVGDFTEHGTVSELARFKLYLDTIPAKYIILVPGNHDRLLETEPKTRNLFSNYHLLINQELRIYDLESEINLWGSPDTAPWDNWAFNTNDEQRKKIVNRIPTNTEILLTHGPPKGILDQTQDNQNAGCQYLLERLQNDYSIHYHFFAHIHEAYGYYSFIENIYDRKIKMYNVSLMNAQYQPFNPPITIEL